MVYHNGNDRRYLWWFYSAGILICVPTHRTVGEDFVKLEYTAEDFKEVGLIKLWIESECFADSGVPDRMAKVANALLPEIKKAWLAELVKDAPKVYGISPRPYEWTYYQVSSELPSGSTHTARLVEIGEIAAIALGEKA